MKLNYLRSMMKRKDRVTTNSNHTFSISKNHLNRAFISATLNEVWVSDITYMRTAQGCRYLTIIIDLYDLKAIGCTVSSNLVTKEPLYLLGE
mgnify:CR=1 FL=1|tara:strand:+ start:76 stop:351 length:276 start_codon:yes stop_codon:yes gene_type:complete